MAYALSTFRTLGTAATPQNIFVVENPSASGRTGLVRMLSILFDTTAVLATVAPLIKVSRPAVLPTGGTVLTPIKYSTAEPACSFIFRGGTASDGGAATAITATAGTPIRSTMVDRLHTAVGLVIHDTKTLLDLENTDPFLLAPGEAILVQAVGANAATTHFVVNILIEQLRYNNG